MSGGSSGIRMNVRGERRTGVREKEREEERSESGSRKTWWVDMDMQCGGPRQG